MDRQEGQDANGGSDDGQRRFATDQKGTGKKRVDAYEGKLTESAAACRFARLADLSIDRLEKWLSQQRTSQRDMGAALYNSYREAWFAFGNWCIGKRQSGKQKHFGGEKRLIANPFDGMARLDEQAERRRKARALTENELLRLVELSLHERDR